MILALQCCPHDAQQAVELTSLICDIEPKKRSDIFCISSRRDVHPMMTETIAKIASEKFERVLVVNGTRAATGWPAGPNEQWSETMMRVSLATKNSKLNETGVLTFEADCVPLRADWIDVLKEKWAATDARGMHVAGHADGLPANHINGNAIFRIGLLRHYPQLNGAGAVGWDMYHGRLLLDIGEDIDAITQRYRWHDYDRKQLQAVRKNGIVPALFHGAKGGNAVGYVREMLNDGTLAEHAKSQRGHYRTFSVSERRRRNCLVRPHEAGFFSLVNNVATCCDMFENVIVDWRGDHIYASKDGDTNMWDHFFASRAAKGSFDLDTESFELQAGYPDWHLTSERVAKHYTSGSAWRNKYHSHWVRWVVRNKWLDKANDFVKENLGDAPVIAVQVRASQAHANEQTSGKLQTLGEYDDAIRAEISNIASSHGVVPKIYVAASDSESAEHFQREFNAIIYPHTRRSKNRSIDFHVENPQTFEDAENCLVEVLIMSMANTLIHPVSNMATAALYINPRLKSIYLP